MAQLKRTLQQVRKHHAISLEELTTAARLPRTTVYLADIGTAISQTNATRIIETLAQLTGEPYTLDNVAIEVSTRALPSYASSPPHIILRRYDQWQAEIEAAEREDRKR